MLAWMLHPLRGFWVIAQKGGKVSALETHLPIRPIALNRITVATEGPFSGSVGRWKQSFTLDAWGNTKQNVVRGTIPAFQQNASTANRPDQTGSGFTYDATFPASPQSQLFTLAWVGRFPPVPFSRVARPPSASTC
jgi:hypothetical protein